MSGHLIQAHIHSCLEVGQILLYVLVKKYVVDGVPAGQFGDEVPNVAQVVLRMHANPSVTRLDQGTRARTSTTAHATSNSFSVIPTPWTFYALNGQVSGGQDEFLDTSKG